MGALGGRVVRQRDYESAGAEGRASPDNGSFEVDLAICAGNEAATWPLLAKSEASYARSLLQRTGRELIRIGFPQNGSFGGQQESLAFFCRPVIVPVAVAVQLSKETEKDVTSSLREFLLTELEVEVGNLQAGQLLGFFLSEVAPTIYNQAIADAGRYLHEKMTELPAICYEPEFQHSERKRPGVRKGR